MGLAFRKKGFQVGTIRDYDSYGKYQKQPDGSWKRLKAGYPAFRRTEQYYAMKSFLIDYASFGEVYLEKQGAPQLKELIKSRGWTRRYHRWLEERKNGKEK